MFGFITPNFKTLSEEEKSRYQSVYCGLCHSIRDKYNNISRLALTYDLTFLNLLLNSLYEPKEAKDNCNCVFHPGNKYEASQSKYSNYCADLTVILAYHKMKDDVEDDKNIRAKIGVKALQNQYNKVKQRDLCELAENKLKNINALEKQNSIDSGDIISKEFGLILAKMFSPKNDIFSETLAKFGANLGRFIYFMDAALDLEKDEKTNSYNPYKKLSKPTKEDLAILAGQATYYFEKLPLEQDLHLLQNILYEGMWITYNYKSSKI